MNKRYGVVLIGCGHIGQEHIEDIYFRDNIRVVATVDTREEQARLFARRYGADHYGTDYRPFLRLPETDIVIIATYVNTHLSILRDCLEAGKHVLCESPLPVPWRRGRPFTVWLRAPRARCWWPISCGTTVPIKPRPA